MDIATGETLQPSLEGKPQKKAEGKTKAFIDKVKSFRAKKPREVLVDAADAADHAAKEIQPIPESVAIESVQEAAEMIENISLFDKSFRILKSAKGSSLGALPAIATGVGVMALSHIAGGYLSSEAASLLMTTAAGGSAAFDGRTLREDLKHPNVKKIAGNAAAALLIAKGLGAAGTPFPDVLAGFVDDAALPLMKMLPILSVRTGGTK